MLSARTLYIVHPDIDFFSGNDQISTRYGSLSINQSEVAQIKKINPTMVIYDDGNQAGYKSLFEQKLTIARFNESDTGPIAQIKTMLDDYNSHQPLGVLFKFGFTQADKDNPTFLKQYYNLQLYYHNQLSMCTIEVLKKIYGNTKLKKGIFSLVGETKAGFTDFYVDSQVSSTSLKDIMTNPSIKTLVGLIVGEPSISAADAQTILQYILNLSPNRPIYKS
jgi:hypothetical protein